MAGGNLREEIMEGSLRAVNRTASPEDGSVGFNVFPRYWDSVSESYLRLQWGWRQNTGSRTGRVQRKFL